jgi:glutaminase
MKEKGAFPKGTDLLQTLELYFQCCSLEMSSDQLSVVASTLANGGVSPLTGERLLLPDTVKNCLSLMSSCGMYDFSGEFAFTIGIPSKSGVGGGIMAVIPNLMGIAVYSPRLDALGNSVRGLAFFKELIKRFNFHNYDSLVSGFQQKKDPRVNKYQKKLDSIMSLCWAASTGDVEQLQNLLAKGVDPNQSDYDGRTALHLAASEGHLHAVEYLLHHGAQSDAKDRWGNTPLDDAIRGHHEDIVGLLNKN